MIITILAVLLLVSVLLRYLNLIIDTLVSIGGNGKSYLAKLRMGLRAIETETGHLPSQVSRLNSSLSDIAGGLMGVENELKKSIDAAINQEKYNGNG